MRHMLQQSQRATNNKQLVFIVYGSSQFDTPDASFVNFTELSQISQYYTAQNTNNKQTDNQLGSGCDLQHLRKILVKTDRTFRNISIFCTSVLIH